ncbi:hypothetical protein LTS18_004693, partial [Coniosporium uncinatum]
SSLAQTVEQVPILVGQLDTQTPDFSDSRKGRLEARRTSDTSARRAPEIIFKDLRSLQSSWQHTYDELYQARMPLSVLDSEVLAPSGPFADAEGKMLVAQANFIPGGLLLCVCVHHTLMDANGAGAVIKAWSENCANLQNLQAQGKEPFELSLRAGNADRRLRLTTSPLYLDAYDELKTKPELWKALGLDHGRAPPLPSSIPYTPSEAEVTTGIFHFSSSALSALKLSAALASPGGEWISKNDAMMALLWRCIMRARFSDCTDIDADSVMAIAINGRSRLVPPLPNTYIGNVIFSNQTPLPLYALLSEDISLAMVASAIRKSIRENTAPERLQEALQLASCIPDTSPGALSFAFPAFVDSDLVSSSWVDLPLYELDWGSAFAAPPKRRDSGLGESLASTPPTTSMMGLENETVLDEVDVRLSAGSTVGKIDFLRMPAGQFQGLCMVLPKRRDGGVEVAVGMKRDHLRKLKADAEFMKWAEFTCE